MSWWQRLIHRRRFEDALDKELRFHFDAQLASYLDDGMDETEARRRTRLEFGGLDQIKEACRDERGTAWMEALSKDVALTFRGLRRSPGFAAGAIGTLALGLGATITIFNVLYAAVLKPLPYAAPSQLIAISASIPQMRSRFPSLPVRAVDFLEFRRSATFLTAVAALAPAEANLSGNGDPQHLHGARVSANLFPLLGVNALRGRTFTADEDEAGGPRVVIVSHDLWKNRFGGDPELVNRTIDLDGVASTVVGVMPGLLFPAGKQLHPLLSFGPRIDFWRPLSLTPDEISSEGSWDYGVIARVSPGASIEQTRTLMEPIRAAIESRVRAQAPGLDVTLNFDIVPLADIFSRGFRRELILLFAAVAVLFLIACANLANLMLARSTSRRREFATRAALGATRSRLVRHVVTESLVLAALGAVAGLLLAPWSASLLLSLAPADTVMLRPSGLDAPVVLFAAAAMVIATVLSGAVPALQAAAANLHEEVKDGGRGAASSRRATGRRRALIGVEVAMATSLLVVAGLLLHSFANITGNDRGFTDDEVLAVDLSLSPDRYPPVRSAAFYQEIVERTRALPGVRSAGAVSVLPLVHESITKLVRHELDTNLTADLDRPIAIYRTVEGDYFDTLGVPLLAGRLFRDPESAPAGIISATLARQLWPGDRVAAAIGRRVRHGDLDTPLITVVGVVGDVRTGALDRDPMPAIYRPEGQAPSTGMTVVVRTTGAAPALAPAVRAQIQALDKTLPISAVRTLNDIVSASVTPRRFQLLMIGLFAALALTLAVIGVWGVTSYSVSLQRHDLSVRVALGAERRRLLAGVIAQTLGPVVIGLVVGLGVAAGASTLIRGALYGIHPLDPLAFAATAGLLLISASLGCYLPAQKAAHLDPAAVLRSE
jgi:predicted permease